MGQPTPTIQDSISAQQTARLWFNRNQYITYRFFGTTTTNTTNQELFLDGISGARLVLPSDCAVMFHAMCVGYNATSPTESVAANITGAIRRTGTTTTNIGTPTNTAYNDGTPTASYAVIHNDTNDCLRVEVATAPNETVYHEVILVLAVATNPESNFGSLS